MRTNPFRPNSPINPGMFVGRVNELERLEQAFIQTKAGEPVHFMITGERGIGKTSLLFYLQALAQGNITFNSMKFNFLVLDLDIDTNTTQLGLIHRIKMHLDDQLEKNERARTFLKDAWSFLQRVHIMDSGITPETEKVLDEVMVDEFVLTLAQVCKRICNTDSEDTFSARYEGVLLIIDEADNCSSQLHLGSFIKLLTERLQRYGCDRILVGLAGMPDLRDKLYVSHPSSLRVFEDMQLDRLKNSEVSSIISICLEKASKDNDEEISITDEARKMLVSFSEGYPHFIQQFGYSAFAYDTDRIIDKEDVIKSGFGMRGALNAIGNRYYRDDFYNKIQQDSYRQVLRIMAEDLDGWVTRTKIKSQFRGKEATLNNALKALRDRHIIIPKQGAKGVYRLQHKGFALWIRLFADPDLLNLVEKKELPHEAEPPDREIPTNNL
jgi:AAA ATPase domain